MVKINELWNIPRFCRESYVWNVSRRLPWLSLLTTTNAIWNSYSWLLIRKSAWRRIAKLSVTIVYHNFRPVLQFKHYQFYIPLYVYETDTYLKVKYYSMFHWFQSQFQCAHQRHGVEATATVHNLDTWVTRAGVNMYLETKLFVHWYHGKTV